MRPHLDYGDVIYDQPNKTLCQTIESAQYKVVLPITIATKRAYQAKVYKELGLKTLKCRQ